MWHLGPVIHVFALLLPIWQSRPITSQDIYPGPYPPTATAETIALQAEGMGHAGPVLRTMIVQNLGLTNSPVATRALLTQLNREPDADVKTTILLQLATALPLDDLALAGQLASLLEHEKPSLRAAACTVLAKAPDCPVAAILRRAVEDPAPDVRLAALRALVPHGAQLDFHSLGPLRAFEDPFLRQAGWTASLHARGALSTPQVGPALQDPAPSVRAVLARELRLLPPATRKAVAAALLADPHPTVRAELAVGMGSLEPGENEAGLIALARDPDPEVRRLAAQQLRTAAEPDAAKQLVTMLGDPSVFVRAAAETSAIALHALFPLADQVASLLDRKDATARYHAYNVLGKTGEPRHATRIAGHLVQEEDPGNLAAALAALYHLADRGNQAMVLGYADHNNANVRTQVALGLGLYDTPEARRAIANLLSDPDNAVAAAAIEAAGRTRHAAFAPHLLRVLHDTGMTARYTPRHRGIACWSASRLRPVNRALMDRLAVQATRPVIAAMGVNLFEPDDVLVSACFALASVASDNPDLRPLAQSVIDQHQKVWSATDRRSAGPNVLVPSPELREFGRQAEALLQGVAVEPATRPTRNVRPVYRALD